MPKVYNTDGAIEFTLLVCCSAKITLGMTKSFGDLIRSHFTILFC